MKAVFVISELSKNLKYMAPFVPAKDGLGDPTGIKVIVNSEEKKLIVLLNTGKLAMKVPVDIDDGEEGEVVVRFNDLNTAVSSLGMLSSVGKDTVLTISTAAFGMRLVVVGKNSAGKKMRAVRTISALHRDIGNVNIVSDGSYVKLSSSVLFDALSAISPSYSLSRNISGFSGVLFSVKEDTFKVVSTNSVTLSECVVKIEKQDIDINVVLPAIYVSKLSSSLSKQKNVDIKIRVTDKMCLMYIGDTFLVLPLVNKAFPSYSSLLKTDSFFVVSTKEFRSSIRSAVSSARKADNYRVSINAVDSDLIIKTLSYENDSMPVESAGELILHIDMNIQYLISVISLIKSDKILVYYNSNKTLIIIKPYTIDKLAVSYVIALLR